MATCSIHGPCCCCGIEELYDIQYGDTVIDCVRQAKARSIGAVIIFSVSDDTSAYSSPKIGRALAAFIRKNKLGRVSETPWAYNGNSGNKIKVFTWTVNRDNLKKIVLDK